MFKPLLAAGLLISLPLLRVEAEVTPIRSYPLGEADSGAVAGASAALSADTGGSNALVLTGAPLYSAQVPLHPGGAGLSLAFDGTNQGDAAVLPTLNDNFALEAWVRPTAPSSGNVPIVYNGDPGANGWGLIQQGGDVIGLFGGVTSIGRSPLPMGSWTHLALVRADGRSYLFVNGATSGNSSVAVPLPALGTFSAAGSPPPGANRFTGLLDAVRVLGFAPGDFRFADLNYPFGRLFLEGTAAAPALRWSSDLPWTPQTTTDLVAGNWSALATPPTPTDGFQNLALPPLGPRQFFRLSTPSILSPFLVARILYNGGFFATVPSDFPEGEDYYPLGSIGPLQGNVTNALEATTGGVDPRTGLAGAFSYEWTVYPPRFYATLLGVSAETPYVVRGFTGMQTAVFSIGSNSLPSLASQGSDPTAQYWRCKLTIRQIPFDPAQAATQESVHWFRFRYVATAATIPIANSPFENAQPLP